MTTVKKFYESDGGTAFGGDLDFPKPIQPKEHKSDIEHLNIKIDFIEGIIAENEEGFIGTIKGLAIVETGKTKQEVLAECLTSIKVLLAYNSGIELPKPVSSDIKQEAENKKALRTIISEAYHDATRTEKYGGCSTAWHWASEFMKDHKELVDAILKTQSLTSNGDLIEWLNSECPAHGLWTADLSHDFAENLRNRLDNLKSSNGDGVEAIEFAEWIDGNFKNYAHHGKYSWGKIYPYQNTMLQISTKELFQLFKNK